MRNLHHMIRFFFALFTVIACLVLSMQCALAQSDQPLGSRLVEELRIYQESFQGLSWTMTTTSSESDDVRAEHVSTRRFRYSNDGQILESESEIPGRADGAADPNRKDRAVSKSYRKEGWIFNASGYSPDRGESRETTPILTVTFYDTSSDGAIANGAGLQMGFIERWTFAEFAKASSNAIESEPINGTDYWALKCEIPQESTNSEEEGTEFLNITRCTEFSPLLEELSPIIQFDFLPLPGDGRERDTGKPGHQVSSQEEPTVGYELRAGKIVRDVD